MVEAREHASGQVAIKPMRQNHKYPNTNSRSDPGGDAIWLPALRVSGQGAGQEVSAWLLAAAGSSRKTYELRCVPI